MSGQHLQSIIHENEGIVSDISTNREELTNKREPIVKKHFAHLISENSRVAGRIATAVRKVEANRQQLQDEILHPHSSTANSVQDKEVSAMLEEAFKVSKAQNALVKAEKEQYHQLYTSNRSQWTSLQSATDSYHSKYSQLESEKEAFKPRGSTPQRVRAVEFEAFKTRMKSSRPQENIRREVAGLYAGSMKECMDQIASATVPVGTYARSRGKSSRRSLSVSSP